MNSIFLLLIVVVAVIIVLVVLKAKSQRGTSDEVWPFYAKKPLSQPEQVLYFRLIQALPEHIILAQVQLSRLLGVKKGNNYRAWSNRINRMSADFVVCNKDSSVAAVIELDDATHQRKDRQVADAKKIKLWLLRVSAWCAGRLRQSQILLPFNQCSCLTLRSSGTRQKRRAPYLDVWDLQ